MQSVSEIYIVTVPYIVYLIYIAIVLYKVYLRYTLSQCHTKCS